MNLYDLSQPSKKKKPQLISEMDKSQKGPPGWNISDDDSHGPDVHLGPDSVVKASDVAKKSSDTLTKAFQDAHKKKDVGEGSLNEFAPGGGGDSGDYLRALASAWYNGTFDSGSLQKGIKSQEDVERLLNRGIVCPDGKTRKLHIDYNSDFDGVEIYSDDYYEHGDLDGNDGRTGQPWGPYDHMEFKDEELDEGVTEGLDPYRLERLDPQTRRVLTRMTKHAEPGSWLSAAESYAMQLGLEQKNENPRAWEQEVQYFVDLYRQYSGQGVAEGAPFLAKAAGGLALGALGAAGAPAIVGILGPLLGIPLAAYGAYNSAKGGMWAVEELWDMAAEKLGGEDKVAQYTAAKIAKLPPDQARAATAVVKKIGESKQDIAEAGYTHGFADPNAPSLSSRRRDDDEGHSEFDDRIRRQTGMIFYNVDDVETARAIGLQQTRTGKWYLRTGNRHAQQTADRAFGIGRIWYPKNETVESENLSELSNELLGRYKKELGVRARAADHAGDYDKGHEYFKKITRATLRQGENDARRHAEKENDMMETRLNMMRKAGYDL